jgi:hypothetical protein
VVLHVVHFGEGALGQRREHLELQRRRQQQLDGPRQAQHAFGRLGESGGIAATAMKINLDKLSKARGDWKRTSVLHWRY